MQRPESILESPQSLMQREKEILIFMLEGASDRDRFEHLLISIHTVKEYGKSIRRKDQPPQRGDPPGPADLGWGAARPMPRQTRQVETGAVLLLWGQELAPLAL